MQIDHPEGFSMKLPDSWEVMPDPPHDYMLVGMGPINDLSYHRNVVVSASPLDADHNDPRTWQLESLESMAGPFIDLKVIDVEMHTNGFRRLMTYEQFPWALTGEQFAWHWPHNGELWGMTLSFTNTSPDHLVHLEEMHAIVNSWQSTIPADQPVAELWAPWPDDDAANPAR